MKDPNRAIRKFVLNSVYGKLGVARRGNINIPAIIFVDKEEKIDDKEGINDGKK